MRSGSVNCTIPLLTAQGRGGWGVPFALGYNSQMCRKDNGGNWMMGRDLGYGLGWRLQAGSLTPYLSDFWTLDHYVFIDATGAEYRLDIEADGIWRSREIRMWCDADEYKLYFPDASRWTMGSMSGSTEQDAGTRYPTLMKDTNGNYVKIRYDDLTGDFCTIRTNTQVDSDRPGFLEPGAMLVFSRLLLPGVRCGPRTRGRIRLASFLREIGEDDSHCIPGAKPGSAP